MKNKKTAYAMAFILANFCGTVFAASDDIGTGSIGDPVTPPPDNTTESCTSSVECAWQELLAQLEAEAER